MKIALFGGSFNPVHNGHIKAAEAVLKNTSIEQVWFLPCYIHAFKKNHGFAPEKNRLEMLRLALRGKKKMKLSLFEIETGKKTRKESRTLLTVRKIRKKYPEHSFSWVIGSNLVREIKQWAGFKELVKEIRFTVVPIKGSTEWKKEKWLNENKAIILPKKAAVKAISSSKIRKLLAKKKPVTGLLPESVEKYITQKMLYISEKDFTRKVYNTVLKIPKGRVSTYREIAIAIGKPKAFRAVGNALNKNPFAPRIPCHRVVKSNTQIGGFSAGTAKKEKMLKKEGIPVKNHKIGNFNRFTVKAQELKNRN